MVYQPRRHAARLTGLLLCSMGILGLLLGMPGRLGAGTGSTRAAAEVPPTQATGLDAQALPIFTALNRVRARSDLPELDLDEALVDSAERDACAIARGEMPLSGDEARLAEAGGERENVGLVVETDPARGAWAMHEWWTQSRAHRADRLDPGMHRYGIGACTNEERTYYVERFAF